MKLLRFGPAGAEKPGILDAHGAIRDLSGHVHNIDGDALSPAGLEAIRRIDIESLLRVPDGQRLGPCVARPLNFVCVGLNYADHAAETGTPLPDEPVLFLKSVGAFSGPNDDVRLPRSSRKADWEVELGVVIGTKADAASEDEAMEHIAGYCLCNDVSEREYQLERGGTWDKGKGCPTFGPTGPWLVTKDEVPDPQSLSMWLEVDGRRVQDGSTAAMVFGVRRLVSYISHFFTLYPGDVISTGTPSGTGLGMRPEPVFLKPGQTMRLGIEGLGEQAQRVVATP